MIACLRVRVRVWCQSCVASGAPLSRMARHARTRPLALITAFAGAQNDVDPVELYQFQMMWDGPEGQFALAKVNQTGRVCVQRGGRSCCRPALTAVGRQLPQHGRRAALAAGQPATVGRRAVHCRVAVPASGGRAHHVGAQRQLVPVDNIRLWRHMDVRCMASAPRAHARTCTRTHAHVHSRCAATALWIWESTLPAGWASQRIRSSPTCGWSAARRAPRTRSSTCS